jgi:two-component system, OmpR family, sensor kinase
MAPIVMASLRNRLIAGIGAFVLVTGLVAGSVAFKWSFDETIELQDSVLVQIGALVASREVPLPLSTEAPVDAEARITIEELGKPGTNDLSSDLPDGLQTVARGGEQWRLLVRTRADGSRVAVGQPADIRDHTAIGTALRTALPLAALIPCLTLLVAIVVNRTLRPVQRLADRLDGERGDTFGALPLTGMPAELRPFIASINRLLGHITTMVDQKRRFIADAAHELRTPIAALGFQAENLERVELPAESRERLHVVTQGIRRVAHLLEQLLALARYESEATTPVPVDFDQVARDCIAELLPLASSRDIDLGFERLEPVVVRAEATALAIVLRNLLGNAVRHTPAGGRIDVDLHRNGDIAVIRVTDSGPGIADEDLERVFEPFFRGTNQGGEGTGLGLSIVRRIVDGFGGTIALENRSAPSATGLRVTATLPAAPGLQQPARSWSLTPGASPPDVRARRGP